jgi:predicted RNA binding protein YcfA (HicA-like mRNA interferase family)
VALQPTKGQIVPKVRDIIGEMEADGWVLDHMTGGHRQYKHPTKPGTVTIPGHPNQDLPPGTVSSIRRQAGLKGKKR